MSETKTRGMLEADKLVQSLCGQDFQINVTHHGVLITGSRGERGLTRNKEQSLLMKCVVFGPAVAQEAERVAVFLGLSSTNVE